MLVTVIIGLIMIGFDQEVVSFSNGNKDKNFVRIFELNVNNFVQCDPEKLPNNPYTAFNNAPTHYVDLNGKAPKTAAQILSGEFGEHRTSIYNSFDARMNSEHGTLQIHDFYMASLAEVEMQVDQLLEEKIPREYAGSLRNNLKKTYKKSIREIINHGRSASNSGQGSSSSAQASRYQAHELHEYKVTFEPTSPEEISAHQFWERDNLALSIYKKEVPLWYDLNKKLIEANKMLKGEMTYNINSQLSPIELMTLYQDDSYVHSVNFRARVNFTQGYESTARSMRTLPPVPFAYYQMNRGQYVYFNRGKATLRAPLIPLIQ